MCGFSGFITPNASSLHLQETVKSMNDAIAHRGPDGDGYWVDPEFGVALGHRRLAILDLSEQGKQPMTSQSGRYVIVFNGEIYNFKDVKQELEHQPNATLSWRGHSDTEIMLAAFEHWGIEGSLQRFVGMFSFALWDVKEKSLTLARDRAGEKPLYFGWSKDTLLFGSELKALRAHPHWSGDLNPRAVDYMLRYGYVPCPLSIYSTIKKLPPGTYITLTGEELKNQKLPPEKPYWSLRDSAFQQKHPLPDHEAIDSLNTLLTKAVSDQMVADVPLGAFLSGGVDSSAIVALMQKQSSIPVRTFSIGFNEEGFNEAEHAKAVAKHLGTDHTELYVTNQDALQVIPKLPTIYDEPFGDSSQIPTYLVSKLARANVTVSLSGDAGDEVFGGYNRYLLADRLWRSIGFMPLALRKVLALMLRALPVSPLNSIGNRIPKAPPMLGDKLQKLSSTLTADGMDIYNSLVTTWPDHEELVRTISPDHLSHGIFKDDSHGLTFTEQLMYLDSLTYLPDDILAKVDRAAMANSLETRVPMLDHRVMEFAWGLPLNQKIRNGETKWLLRQVLYKYVPRPLIDRPKMGFGVPIDSWLRGALKDWADELLSEASLQRSGLINPEHIQRKWQEHLSGTRNWQYPLWNVLMFQAWLQETH